MTLQYEDAQKLKVHDNVDNVWLTIVDGMQKYEIINEEICLW